MRVDVLILQRDAPPSELLARARQAEEMGFDAVWVADHFISPFAPEADWFDGWSLLAALALATSRIRIGPLVSAPVLRAPSLLALQATTVDHLSGGRLELGIGAGGAPLDFTMMGVAERDAAERFGRLVESVEIVDELLANGRVAYHGRFYDLEARVARPVQRPRPPFMIGALGERALRFAAANADAISTFGVRPDGGSVSGEECVTMIRERMTLLEAECDRIGRDRSTLRRSMLTFFGAADPLPTPAAFRRWTAPYHEMGIDEFVLYWPKDDTPARLAALAQLEH